MKEIIKTFYVILIFLSAQGFGQTPSLTQLENQPSDSAKKIYIKQVLKNSKELGFDSTLTFFDHAIEYYRNKNNDELTTYIRKKKARLFGRFSQQKKELELLQEMIEERSQEKDTISLAVIYADIGMLYFDQNNKEKYLEYTQKAIDVLKNKESKLKGDIYNNLLAYYMSQPDQMNLALEYAKKAIGEYEKFRVEEKLPNVYTNMGTIYYYKSTTEGYQSALNYYEKSRELFEKFGNKYGQATALLNKGYVHQALGQAELAKKEGLKALEIFEQIDDKVSLSDCYWFLSDINFELENYKEAYIAKDSFYYVEKQVRAQETKEALLELETKFQTKEKEKENQLLKSKNQLQEAEIKMQNMVGLALGGGVALFMVISGLVYVQFRNKKKANQELSEKNIRIEEQHEEISSQRDQLEIKNHVLAEQKQEITESINYAKRIQRALLNVDQEITKFFPPFFIYFQPRDIVSGDFYWATEKNGYIYATAADCTGHGVPGAFMSMLGISFINEIIKSHKEVTPATLLNDLRERVINELGQGDGLGSKDGMDMALIRYHRETGEVLYAGANNPLYVVTGDMEKEALGDRKTEIEGSEKILIEIKADKQPVGYHSKSQNFTDKRLLIKPGESIYMSSDGFADQFGGPKSKKIGYKKFKQILLENHTLPLEEQRQYLKKFYNNWIEQSTEEQIDDVCVIGIRFE